jgi:tRNA A-37 threonylcarbamoyl transferase component Bud32
MLCCPWEKAHPNSQNGEAMNALKNIPVITYDNGRLLINAAYAELLQHNDFDTASQLWDIDGIPVKNAVKTRGTFKTFLRDPSDGKSIEVYIKRYLKPSFKDRFKCAISLKPLFSDGAIHEWHAICRFHELGLKTMVPLAAARLGDKTCNLTMGITDYVRASDFFSLQAQVDTSRKQKIIKNIADLAGIMHSKGLAHQDFYLVHIFIRPNENDAVYLIDLQRTIMQEKLSLRWRIKDLGQITFATEPFFSSEETALFRDIYLAHNPDFKNKSVSLWQAVEKKARRIKQHTRKHNI